MTQRLGPGIVCHVPGTEIGRLPDGSLILDQRVTYGRRRVRSIPVFVGKERAGSIHIISKSRGYQYRRNANHMGEIYSTLEACQQSITP